MKCRHCDADLKLPLVDLGSAPPSNAYLTEQTLHAPEKWFPLRVLVCESCWLVQTEDFAQANELFDADYAYFSGFSTAWQTHCDRYVADMVTRWGFNSDSLVVEVAANDGTLLDYVQKRGIPCFGIEPTASTAATARTKGIQVVQDFFTVKLAQELIAAEKQPDLMVANNVLAHVPNINDFVGAFAILLKPQGVATFEFPHLLKLIEEHQFDTIYHEHFSYLSLTVVNRIFNANGLTIFDVDELPTHGGSLRVFAQRSDFGKQITASRVKHLLNREEELGIMTAQYYRGFQTKVNQLKHDFLGFLLAAKRENKTIAGYGAAAKGNTLLNYGGVRADLLSFVVDRNPVKQGKFLPGSRIPIVDEHQLRSSKPDYVVILPWNIKEEVMHQLEYVRSWNGKFVVAVPQLSVE